MATSIRDHLRSLYPSLPREYFEDVVNRWLDQKLTLAMTSDLLLAERHRRIDDEHDAILRPLLAVFGILATVGFICFVGVLLA